jgi:hypothetical protein
MKRSKAASDKRQRVLFIGNSFTARNNLPALIATIAEQSGHQIDHQLISAGGASLRRHWNAGEARGAIQAGQLDVVVLQEQSTLPIKNRPRMHENVRLFDPIIRESGARTALYMTWAREHAPQTQQTLTEAYTSIAEEVGAILVPVGVAWKRCLREQECPPLFDTDGSHPSMAGSYLAACVFAAALCGGDVLDAAPATAKLDEPTAKFLARVAKSAITQQH